MQMRPNLNFAGHAAEVLAHYQAAFGGELEITRFAGSPAAGDVPPDWGDKILYGRLSTPFGEIDVMDAPPGRESAVGGNVAIAVDIDDEGRAEHVFAKLAADGTILMPFEPMFFARRFGMANDKFGVRWMVVVAPVVAAPKSSASAAETDGYVVYPGGGTKPPNSRSINAAKASVVRSSKYGPMI
jgi:PhnB protein